MFKVGDKVVCVNSYNHYSGLVLGNTYTIKGTVDALDYQDNYVQCLTLEEVEEQLHSTRFVLASEYSAADNLKEQSASRYLPDDDAQRKDYPLFDGLLAYFPNALCEISRWSKAGNEQHNPGEELHWSKDKSTDHKNKIMRHLLDAEQVNNQGFYEAVGMAWRALALCEEILVASGKPWGPNVR